MIRGFPLAKRLNQCRQVQQGQLWYRNCYKLSIPLEKVVDQIEVRLVDRQEKYEKYHDAIYSNLKSDMRNLRNTADLFLETSAKGDITQELKSNLHVVQNTIKSLEIHLADIEEEARKNSGILEQVPSVIDGKVSNSAAATGKEINMLKEMITTLRDDKKKEVTNLKAEISALREEMKNDVIALKAEIKSSRSEFKADTRGAMSMMYYRLLIGVFSTAAMAIAAFQSLGNLTKKKEKDEILDHSSVIG